MNVESYKIVCAYCGVMRNYPEDFPNRLYAECRICIYARSKKKKMRKGWFKKAKSKFVKKRVYRWTMASFGAFPRLEMYHNGRFDFRSGDKNERYQVLEHIKNLGFVAGFLYARKLFKSEGAWGFHFDKRVKLEEGERI